MAICQNGAVTVDVATGRILDRFPLSPHVARQLIRRLKARLPESAFAAEAGEVFRYEPSYESEHESPGDAEIAVAEALADDRLTKLIVKDRGRAFEELLALVVEEVGDAAAVSYSGTTFVEITAPGVTKLAALQRLARGMSVPAADVIAFGDMPIDIPMLMWAGRGVAMGNSHPEVLASPVERTLSNDEDGLAIVLEGAGFVG